MGTYTTNYNLFMPTVGEQGWGELVNGNFTTIDTTMKGLDTYVRTLENEANAVEARVGTLESKVSTIESEVNGDLVCNSVTADSISTNSITLVENYENIFTSCYTTSTKILSVSLSSTASSSKLTFRDTFKSSNSNKFLLYLDINSSATVEGALYVNDAVHTTLSSPINTGDRSAEITLNDGDIVQLRVTTGGGNGSFYLSTISRFI